MITLNDGKQDDNDEEEEGDVKDDTIYFVFVTIRRLDLITDSTTSTNSFVEMKHEALWKVAMVCEQEVNRATPLTVSML